MCSCILYMILYIHIHMYPYLYIHICGEDIKWLTGSFVKTANWLEGHTIHEIPACMHLPLNGIPQPCESPPCASRRLTDSVRSDQSICIDIYI